MRACSAASPLPSLNTGTTMESPTSASRAGARLPDPPALVVTLLTIAYRSQKAQGPSLAMIIAETRSAVAEPAGAERVARRQLKDVLSGRRHEFRPSHQRARSHPQPGAGPRLAPEGDELRVRRGREHLGRFRPVLVRAPISRLADCRCQPVFMDHRGDR